MMSSSDMFPEFPDGVLFNGTSPSNRPPAVKGLVLPPPLNGKRKLSEDTASLFENLLKDIAEIVELLEKRFGTPQHQNKKGTEKGTETTETTKTTSLPLLSPWTLPVPIPVVAEQKQQQQKHVGFCSPLLPVLVGLSPVSVQQKQQQQQKHFGVCSPPFPVLVGLSPVPVQQKQQQQQKQTKIEKPGPKDQNKMIPAMPMARAMPITESIQLQRSIIVSAKPCNDDTLEDAIHLYNQGEYVPALSILQNLANMILSVRLHNKKPSANHCNTHCMILMYTGMVYVKLHRIKDAIEQFKWVSSHRRALNGVRMPNDNIFQTAHALEQKLSKRGEHFILRKDIAEIVDK